MKQVFQNVLDKINKNIDDSFARYERLSIMSPYFCD